MKERLSEIISWEKLKQFSRKVFTKKKIGAAIAVLVLLTVLKVGYSQMYHFKGTVLKIDGKNIVISNFLGTRTVNVGDYPIDSNRITAGEKVEIYKNLSGDVTGIRIDGRDGRGGRDMKQLGRGDNRFGLRNNRTNGGNNNFNRQPRRDGGPVMPNQGTSDGTSGASVQKDK